MTDAPERIYLDGDVEAGDGMFPRCFESPKYASEPQVEYIRADLATQLQKKKADRDGYDQFWAALEPATPLNDPLVAAVVALIKRAQDIIDPCYPAKHAVWQNDARAALSALEENK